MSRRSPLARIQIARPFLTALTLPCVLGFLAVGTYSMGLAMAGENQSAGQPPQRRQNRERQRTDRSTRLGAGYDRPGNFPHQSRSMILAKNGIVATSHPLASQAGLDILKRGGNAIDAAIAANAMQGVVEPMSCGIGGDLFCIYWDAKSQKLYGLNASGRSPFDLNREIFAKENMEEVPLFGPLSWSVPGCVSGWGALRERFGTMSFEEILSPAIHTAEEGFPVTEVISTFWAAKETFLSQHEDSAATFLLDGRAPKLGEVFHNPNLATTYRRIAEGGAAEFYQGSIADEIVAFSRANGGYFTKRDFTEHTADWVEPVSTNYRGYDLWELPPNGQGIAAIQILNILEGYDLKAMGRNTPEFWHTYTEAKKLAYADRAKFYSDPEFNDLPITELISKEYAAQRRKLIDPNKALVNVPAGDPKLQDGDTIYLTVVDKDRNCCSLIQSNFHGFGSQMVPGRLGFALQNRGNLFSLDEEHLNSLEPHKRPFHTIIPAMVTKDGKPVFCYGVMGGDMQPQGHSQVLINIVDFGLNVQQAGDAARVRHKGSAQPTGAAEQEGGGLLTVERGVPRAVRRALSEKGHRVEVGSGGFGGYQGIWIDWENGVLQGATEPRTDGCAVGY
ncbi:MAG: gamma-glutamyltransferase [Pirellulales bacterium]|nr:gamma-glutamyltransferase [Pirellulales bacterium]